MSDKIIILTCQGNKKGRIAWPTIQKEGVKKEPQAPNSAASHDQARQSHKGSQMDTGLIPISPAKDCLFVTGGLMKKNKVLMYPVIN